MSKQQYLFDIYTTGSISKWSAGKLVTAIDIPQQGPTRLCDYFARLIGNAVSNSMMAPTVTLFAYGQGSSATTFSDALRYMRLMPIAGGNWNVEGSLISHAASNSISMLSAFPKNWGNSAANNLYNEVGFASNYNSFMSIGHFACKTFLEEASSHDPLSLFVFAFAYNADQAKECQTAAKNTLSLLLKQQQ